MKTVHIISHSHWDREWYMPYERHHMLLVELIDDVLELFEIDPEFKSFYLDGQTISLDDYLEVRPEKEDLLRKHIENGKLKIGPFYILQDAYLTSSESNVRNMLMGHQESKKWGPKTEIGYYPDTFGNPGQTPQLMKQLGFNFAAFGRGVKPTGFANQTTEEDNFVSSYSEMNWKGADDSEIIGLLFANWYSNGNEIPSNKEEAQIFWDQKLKEAEAYASTNHLLMMNGCDHQPVQKDLSQAIRVANELYPDYKFIHSDFPAYMKQVMQRLPEDLDTVTGELTSQETEGWYTLTNTASTRTYLKQENDKVGRLLEQVAEPLATLAYEVTGKYPHDQLDYAWKIFMQNHPHDSICACSLDEIPEQMMTRFQNAEQVGRYIVTEALSSLSREIDTESSSTENSIPFIVFNTAGLKKSGIASITIEKDPIYFSEQFPTESYVELKKRRQQFKVVDEDGEEMPAFINEVKPLFNYDLPKDAFRQPYIARNIEVEMYLEDIPSVSWKTFYLVPAAEEIAQDASGTTTLENEYIKAVVCDDGTLSVKDKIQNETYNDLLVFEDCGDIGNEYVYKQPNDEKPILSKGNLIDVHVVRETPIDKVVKLVHEIEVPVSADERLDREQRAVVEFRNRKAQRVTETKTLKIETKVTLEKKAQHLAFETKLTNEMKDHRLRVLFPTGIQTDEHFADTIFETVKRPNQVSEAWTNPENPQRTHRFVQVRNNKQGVIIAPEGLNEYEIIEENEQQTMAITLFRAMGELGDWGYFPTPGAQCLNYDFTFNYSVSFHGAKDKEAIKNAIYRPVNFSVVQTEKRSGSLPSSKQFLHVEGDHIALTALKRNKENDEPITRFYNFKDRSSLFSLKIDGYQPFTSTILEEQEDEQIADTAKPFEIITHKWKRKEKE